MRETASSELMTRGEKPVREKTKS